MAVSFYFYDLETSSVSPRDGRIMQFAGQRTDINLKPVSEPDNILIRLTDDILPEPDAILVTGITPQATRADGLSEAEFLRYFADQIALPDTVFIGYNNVRFDDEFMRFALYRNFYDAYEWSWRDGRSRWDLLDMIRMTRALRPDGIEWPFAADGRPSNRLELLTSVNKLVHNNAHDALSDVNATIAVARLIRNKQPKLFDFLLQLRNKNKVKELASQNDIFVYTSGKYPSIYQKTTLVTVLGEHPGKQGVLVYDLRRNPADIAGMSPAELAAAWHQRVEDETQRFPVKTLQFNRCPAVAPLGVLDNASQERLQLDMETITAHRKALAEYPDLYKQLCAALGLLDKQRQTSFLADEQDVDTQLYDGFIGDKDKTVMSVVRAADDDEISSLEPDFSDPRLTKLFPLYKARNFPKLLTTDEQTAWEAFRRARLLGGRPSRAERYFVRLSELAAREGLTSHQQFLLQELQLYGESILPVADQ